MSATSGQSADNTRFTRATTSKTFKPPSPFMSPCNIESSLSNIEILNSDPVLHNTHGYLCKKLGKQCKRTVFNLALPNQGQTIKKKLKRAGTVKVDCDAHGWMLGWVQVVDNPYYAITGDDGTFTLNDVPPGKYTLVAFQGYTGGVEIPLTVKANQRLEVEAELKK